MSVYLLPPWKSKRTFRFMFGITKPNFFRGLMAGEIRLAREVFHATLPPWSWIGVTNGLNGDGGPWTVDRSWGDILQGAPEIARSPLKYLMGFGDDASKDLSIADPGTLMHEMTHVWQYYHNGSSAITGLRCLYAQGNVPIVKGVGYGYKAGDPFCDYNMEQRAHIVEDWTMGGQKEDDELFPYIHFLIRREGEYRSTNKIAALEIDELCLMNLAQLKAFIVRLHEPVEQQPIPITARDDSLVRIPADTLFDFDKFNLKPSADPVLRQAATTILRSASTTRRLDRILINGHTDSVGDERYNMNLSRQRAESVAQWFSSHGYFGRSLMTVQAFGKSQPIPGNADPAKNRRVEIYVVNR